MHKPTVRNYAGTSCTATNHQEGKRAGTKDFFSTGFSPCNIMSAHTLTASNHITPCSSMYDLTYYGQTHCSARSFTRAHNPIQKRIGIAAAANQTKGNETKKILQYKKIGADLFGPNKNNNAVQNTKTKIKLKIILGLRTTSSSTKTTCQRPLQ